MNISLSCLGRTVRGLDVCHRHPPSVPSQMSPRRREEATGIGETRGVS